MRVTALRSNSHVGSSHLIYTVCVLVRIAYVGWFSLFRSLTGDLSSRAQAFGCIDRNGYDQNWKDQPCPDGGLLWFANVMQ